MQRSARPNGVGGAFRKAVGWAAIAALALGFARRLQTAARWRAAGSQRRKDRREDAQVAGVRPGGRLSRPARRRRSRSRWNSAAAGGHPGLRRRCCRSPTRTARRSRAAGSSTTGRRRRPVLRFPHVEAEPRLHRDHPGRLTAADGSTLGKDDMRRRSTPGRSSRRSASPRRAACCRRAKAAACRWCRSTCRKSTSSSCACATRNCRSFFAEYQRGGRRGSWELERDYSWDDDGERTAARRCRNSPSRSTSTASCSAASSNERVLTYLPLQDIERAAGARPVLRGDEAHRPVQRRVRDRVLHRQRPRPARARLQGQAVRARRVAADRRRASAASNCKVLDAQGRGRAEGQRPTATATRCSPTSSMPTHVLVAHARQRRVDAAVQPAGAGPVRVRGRRPRAGVVRRVRLVRPRPVSPRRNRAHVGAAARPGRPADRNEGQGAATAVRALRAARRQDASSKRACSPTRRATSATRRRFRPTRRPAAGASSSAPIRRARKRCRA